MTLKPRAGTHRVEFGYRNAIVGHEEKYPLLTRAVANMEPAANPRIEWEVRPANYDSDDVETWWNYCQIIRTPWEVPGGNLDDMLHRHLASVESVVRDGIRNLQETNRRTCGGVHYFLERYPNHEDRLSLRPLRDLALVVGVQPRWGTLVRYEWIGEVSLQVDPCGQIRQASVGEAAAWGAAISAA